MFMWKVVNRILQLERELIGMDNDLKIVAISDTHSSTTQF